MLLNMLNKTHNTRKGAGKGATITFDRVLSLAGLARSYFGTRERIMLRGLSGGEIISGRVAGGRAWRSGR